MGLSILCLTAAKFLNDQSQLPAHLPGHGCILLRPSKQIWQHRSDRTIWHILGNAVSLMGQVKTNIIAHAQQLGEVNSFVRSEEHTSELQSLMRISYAVFFLKKKQ